MRPLWTHCAASASCVPKAYRVSWMGPSPPPRKDSRWTRIRWWMLRTCPFRIWAPWEWAAAAAVWTAPSPARGIRKPLRIPLVRQRQLLRRQKVRMPFQKIVPYRPSSVPAGCETRTPRRPIPLLQIILQRKVSSRVAKPRTSPNLRNYPLVRCREREQKAQLLPFHLKRMIL